MGATFGLVARQSAIFDWSSLVHDCFTTVLALFYDCFGTDLGLR